MVSNVNRGQKRICPGCGAPFYDLGKNPAACPKCGAMHDINVQAKPKRKARATIQVDADDPLLKTREVKPKTKKPAKEIEGIDLEEFEDIETLDADEDISELEEIEDIDNIEELEEIEEPVEDEALAEEDIALEENGGDDGLIDDIEELEDTEEEEEAEPERPDPKSKRKK